MHAVDNVHTTTVQTFNSCTSRPDCSLSNSLEIDMLNKVRNRMLACSFVMQSFISYKVYLLG